MAPLLQWVLKGMLCQQQLVYYGQLEILWLRLYVVVFIKENLYYFGAAICFGSYFLRG
jgi:hypothetical protein